MPTPKSDDEGGFKPVPDPTVLTTQQLLRELASVKEFFTARLDAMDKAIILLQDTANRSPTINEVHLETKEKFRSIATQFAERDTRTEQTSRDSKVAVDAALQAAKEAVAEQNKSSALAIAKSEVSTTKQIDQLGLTIQTMTGGLNDKIDDVKERLTSIEGRQLAREGHTKGIGESWGVTVAVIGVVCLIGGVVTAIIALTQHH